MDRDERGWWILDRTLHDGQDYAFELDGYGGLPDPRSPWQPQGVQGPSRHVDHDQFVWTDNSWRAPPLSSAVLYELHIGTFTEAGTFQAVIPRLPHLVALGVTHVEIMPLAQFPGRYGWGYDGVNLFAPHHAYGGPQTLKTLVAACHDHGLAVLLDVVYNHVGPSGNYLSRFGPYFTERYSTFWGPAINFDGPYSDEVRRFFCDNALMWLRDYHFDGLRLDAVHAIVDTSAIPFLEQLVSEVESLEAHTRRPYSLIAESDLNDPRIVRPRAAGGFGLRAQWCDDFHHAIHTVLTGEHMGYYEDFGLLEQLSKAMSQPFLYAGQYSPSRRRSHGRPPVGATADQFVVYLQNHDQIGNRARAERLSHLVDMNRVKIGAALVLMSPYVPMLFQGEEWSASSPFYYFVDFQDDPELARAVVQGRREEFSTWNWSPRELADPTDPSSFEQSKLNWDELHVPEHAEIHEWYASLITLRQRLPGLVSGRLDDVATSVDAARQLLTVHRGGITMFCNFSSKPHDVAWDAEQRPVMILASDAACTIDGHSVRMVPQSVAIVGTQKQLLVLSQQKRNREFAQQP